MTGKSYRYALVVLVDTFINGRSLQFSIMIDLVCTQTDICELCFFPETCRPVSVQNKIIMDTGLD